MHNLFNELIKRFTRSYKYDIENAKKAIKSHQRDIELYEADLKRLPEHIKSYQLKIDECNKDVKEAKKKLELIKEMHLCC